MTNPLQPPEPEDYGQDWHRTIAEAVDRLLLILSQDEKCEIAAMPEGDLLNLHFGLVMKEINATKSNYKDSPCRHTRKRSSRPLFLSVMPMKATRCVSPSERWPTG